MHMLSHALGLGDYYYIFDILHLPIHVLLIKQYPGWWKAVD